jgi:hypothetical protein
MAAIAHDASPPETLADLRALIREHGTLPEQRAVTRLLHALDLTGGARHRAVAVGIVMSGRFWTRFCRSSGSPIKRGLPSCASPKRCCASRMTPRRIA